MIGLSKDLCPKGTVPIPRTTKKDLIYANKIGTLSRTSPGYHIAEVRLRYNNVYFGIQGSLSTYNPPVAKGQMSGAYIWLSSGPNGADSNFIQAGWQVYPDFAKDTRTHFFASWSNSIPRKGCINYLCPGFVQTSRRIFLGMQAANVSTYNGPQFVMNLNLTQDPATKNWWLKAENINVGYFPAALFSNKFFYATNGGWTGRTAVLNGNAGLSPPMGSGHFPDGNPKHSCYISRILFKDRYREDHGPLRDDVWAYADNPVCYGVNYYDYVDDNLQRVLMFGGPGGDCGV